MLFKLEIKVIRNIYILKHLFCWTFLSYLFTEQLTIMSEKYKVNKLFE